MKQKSTTKNNRGAFLFNNPESKTLFLYQFPEYVVWFIHLSKFNIFHSYLNFPCITVLKNSPCIVGL